MHEKILFQDVTISKTEGIDEEGAGWAAHSLIEGIH